MLPDESTLMTFTIDPHTLTGNWSYPTPIRFGPGRIRELAQTCREFGIECPLLVTDPGLAAMSVGTDALSHHLEAWCWPVFHPMAQGIALEGMRLVKEWLPAACGNGTEPAARARMQVASTMGATAFQKGLGTMRSMSHPCGAVYDTHHGPTNDARVRRRTVRQGVPGP